MKYGVEYYPASGKRRERWELWHPSDPERVVATIYHGAFLQELATAGLVDFKVGL